MRPSLRETLVSQALTVSEAAQMAGVHEGTLKLRIGSGELEAVRKGNLSLVDVEDVAALLPRLRRRKARVAAQEDRGGGSGTVPVPEDLRT